ncbi:MAG TPA: SIMPL domain-containing protein, partial [Isosphaeraceae bacterium]|nr:SIMPL domain-containing protein [Isosphaeraceae bacterium]
MIQKRLRNWDGHLAASRCRSHSLRTSRSAIAVIGFALALTGTVRPARAQYYPGQEYTGSNANIEGISVAGKASLPAKPNLVEIDVEVSASSELTADAIVKYRDARRRLHEAYTALKLANVTVEERGLLVDQKGQQQNPYFWGGMPNPRTKTEVQLTRKLVVKASNLRKMDEDALMQLIGKLLDVAQDAGAKVGPQVDYNNYYYYRWNQNPAGLVRFVLEDFDKLQEEAYEKAIADARARAERLARLSRVELGPIVAIREVSVPGDRSSFSNAD